MLKYFLYEYHKEGYNTCLENGDAFAEGDGEVVKIFDTLEEAEEDIAKRSSSAEYIKLGRGSIYALTEYVVEPTEVDENGDWVDCFTCEACTEIEHLNINEFASSSDFREFWRRGLTLDLKDDGSVFKKNEKGLWTLTTADEEQD